ncbi:hypothetical protein GFS31_25330 [Leptolyngbya sp. BL0902]|uniref:hypothetical protein n=1 Tax=Leptolyngbya sp. BL0902 TaxID=1115757 RepID=UPI0018E7BCC4|nr:hypothetical protein [Leptolyngbya sp. BL0902]QQE65843.1 hypothetical protein GFS31_25330 [Leptolyngbya sp. BL0902]
MKFGYRQRRGAALSTTSQRGALGSPTPEPSTTLDDLSTQADQLAARLQHLKTGINNIRHLQSLMAPIHSPDSQRPTTEREEAQAELNQLQQAVEEFEITLASHLLSWQQLREPFWQAIRYGGLGLVGGWVLHWLVRG